MQLLQSEQRLWQLQVTQRRWQLPGSWQTQRSGSGLRQPVCRLAEQQVSVALTDSSTPVTLRRGKLKATFSTSPFMISELY